MKNTHEYEIILLWSKEDVSYIAEVSELAFRGTDGESYQEALANERIII